MDLGTVKITMTASYWGLWLCIVEC